MGEDEDKALRKAAKKAAKKEKLKQEEAAKAAASSGDAKVSLPLETQCP